MHHAIWQRDLLASYCTMAAVRTLVCDSKADMPISEIRQDCLPGTSHTAGQLQRILRDQR